MDIKRRSDFQRLLILAGLCHNSAITTDVTTLITFLTTQYQLRPQPSELSPLLDSIKSHSFQIPVLKIKHWNFLFPLRSNDTREIIINKNENISTQYVDALAIKRSTFED